VIAPPIPGPSRLSEPASKASGAPAPAAAPAKKSGPMQALIQFTERFGSMLSRVLLSVLYFALLGPFAILYRIFADPLHIKPRPQGNWSTWESVNHNLKAARRQD
jgi:hypothetical protein